MENCLDAANDATHRMTVFAPCGAHYALVGNDMAPDG